MADELDTTAPPPDSEPTPSPDTSRFDRIEQQIQGLTAVVANAVTRPPSPPPPPPAPAGDDDSDDALFARAQQGDRRAFEVWTERRADRRVEQRLRGLKQEGLVDQQLTQLSQQYPVFQDVNHPMTTAVRNKYAMMIAEGYRNDKSTLLAAMEKTIASNPTLTAQLYSGSAVAADQQRRQSAGSAASGHLAPAHRAASASRAVPARVRESSPEEMALARRMGIRDPKGAKERFLKRQESGQSSLGAVANFVREEDL